MLIGEGGHLVCSIEEGGGVGGLDDQMMDGTGG